MVSRVTDDKNITLCGSILTLLPVIFVINILLLQFMTKQNPTHEGLVWVMISYGIFFVIGDMRLPYFRFFFLTS